MADKVYKHPWVHFFLTNIDWQSPSLKEEKDWLFDIALEKGLVIPEERKEFYAKFGGVWMKYKDLPPTVEFLASLGQPKTLREMMFAFADPRIGKKSSGQIVKLTRLAEMLKLSSSEKSIANALTAFRIEYGLNQFLLSEDIDVSRGPQSGPGEIQEFVKEHADFWAEVPSQEINKLYLQIWCEGKGASLRSIERTYISIRQARRAQHEKYLAKINSNMKTCKELISGLSSEDQEKILYSISQLTLDMEERIAELESENRNLLKSAKTANSWYKRYRRLVDSLEND